MSATDTSRGQAAFDQANQHALATILEASQTKSIIASTDIFDSSGIKLWARNQPVSQALQRKLLDRQLRKPLESCLTAEDGVTSVSLVKALEELLAADGPLNPLLAPHAATLVREAAYVPLDSVAQLLLTAGQAARPESFDHAVQAMALNGALMASQAGSAPDVRLAMLCGLLHDLGEMYIAPRYGELDADRTLDFESYQQLVIHPHIGKLLLAQLTSYPAMVARAVGEHHERLDGSGYPYCLHDEALSPLGRLLAVTEATLGVLRQGRSDLARISVALRVLPSEYDMKWVSPVARAACAQPRAAAQADLQRIRERMAQLDAALATAALTVDELRSDTDSEAWAGALALTTHQLQRLRAGWYDSGLWSLEAVTEHDAAEVEAIEDELQFRLRSIQRAARLRAGELEDGNEQQLLDQLCEKLDVRALT